MVEKRLVTLSDVEGAVFEGGDDSGHPCGECTVCLEPISEGTRYTTWEFRTSSGHIRLEHICMECDWDVRQRMINRHLTS